MKKLGLIAIYVASMSAIAHLCAHEKGVVGAALWISGVVIGAFFRENVLEHSALTESAG